jgi:hypothetical protein
MLILARAPLNANLDRQLAADMINLFILLAH